LPKLKFLSNTAGDTRAQTAAEFWRKWDAKKAGKLEQDGHE